MPFQFHLVKNYHLQTGLLLIISFQIKTHFFRRLEESFSYLKGVARRFETMTDQNIQNIARARQNHTALFLQHNAAALKPGSVKKSYETQIQEYVERFTLEDAVNEFDAQVAAILN